MTDPNVDVEKLKLARDYLQHLVDMADNPPSLQISQAIAEGRVIPPPEVVKLSTPVPYTVPADGPVYTYSNTGMVNAPVYWNIKKGQEIMITSRPFFFLGGMWVQTEVKGNTWYVEVQD